MSSFPAESAAAGKAADAPADPGLKAEEQRLERTRLRILNVEDSPNDSELLQALLERSGIDCEIVRVDTAPEFRAELRGGTFDLVIADYTLPSFDGPSSLEIARRLCPDMPFVYFSGTVGEEAAIESLKQGASDYVLKQRPARLGSVVRRALADAAAELQRRGMEQELRESEAQLRRALAAKEILLQEVHHRVKNNLQIISSLLNMETRSQPKEIRRVLQESQMRVRAMALVHEQLHAKGNAGELDAADYIRKLATDVWNACQGDGGPVRLRFELQPVLLDPNRSIPCGLILNELVTNALKYAFPDNRAGEILVELSASEDGEIRLRVADNGVGFPSGFDWKQTRSLGFQIVGVLSRQLGATVACETAHGVEFTLTFCKAPKQACVSAG